MLETAGIRSEIILSLKDPNLVNRIHGERNMAENGRGKYCCVNEQKPHLNFMVICSCGKYMQTLITGGPNPCTLR